MLKVFTIYGHGGHPGYVTKLICVYFHFHVPISFPMKFSLNVFFFLLYKLPGLGHPERFWSVFLSTHILL